MSKKNPVEYDNWSNQKIINEKHLGLIKDLQNDFSDLRDLMENHLAVTHYTSDDSDIPYFCCDYDRMLISGDVPENCKDYTICSVCLRGLLGNVRDTRMDD